MAQGNPTAASLDVKAVGVNTASYCTLCVRVVCPGSCVVSLVSPKSLSHLLPPLVLWTPSMSCDTWNNFLR